MKIKYKVFIIINVFILLLCLCINTVNLNGKTLPEPITLIETRDEFVKVLNESKDGEIIFVGNIDFNLNGTGDVNNYERIDITKNIEIKSGYPYSKATLTGVSFNLNGTYVAGEEKIFSFENIIFDGEIKQDLIDDSDWNISYDSQGEIISNDPLKAQYAIQFNGNTTATFNGCEFNNYMHTQGAAIKAYYGSYGSEISNHTTKLNVLFEDCKFLSNSSRVGGGAIYIDALGKNVDMKISNSIFENNVCGLTNYMYGGGAIYARDCILSINNITFKNNKANYIYKNGITYDDTSLGGAIYLFNSEMKNLNCTYVNNIASCGGAISMMGNSDCTVDGNIFTDNIAKPSDDNPNSEDGISSGKGLGGAIYINNPNSGNFIAYNTSIYDNVAENVFGAVFNSYSSYINTTTIIEFNFCSIVNNKCNTSMEQYSHYGEEMWKWFNYPGDFYEIPYVNVRGSLIVDATFEKDFIKYQKPSLENNYNYFASVKQAKEDNILVDQKEVKQYIANNSDIINLTVPTDYVKEIFKDRYSYYLGNFLVGSNSNSKIIYLHSKDEISDITYQYGELLKLPNVEKRRYEFKGWKLENGEILQSKQIIFISPIYEEIHLYASLEKIPLDIPYDLILIVVAIIVLISAIVIAIIKIRKLHLRKQQSKNIDNTPGVENLTNREKQVLNLLLQGKKRSEIASELFVSEETIKKQITSIYSKLGVSSRSELFAKFR